MTVTPGWKVIVENGIGIPYEVSAEVKIVIEKDRVKCRYPFPDIENGAVLDNDEWDLVNQNNNFGGGWKMQSYEQFDDDDLAYLDPGDDFRTIYCRSK